MGIVTRQAAKSTAVNLLGAVLGALSVWVSSVVLSKEGLGGSRFLLNQAVLVQFFLLLGVPVSVFVFSPRYQEGDERRRVLISTAVLTPVITTIIFCVPYFLLKDEIVARFQADNRAFMSRYYGWLPLYALLYSFFAVFEFYLGNYYKVALTIFMREVLLRLGNLALLAAVALEWISFPQFIGGTVLIIALPIALITRVAMRTESFRPSLRWKVFSGKERREIFRFTWYHLLTGLSVNLLPFLDVVLIGPLASLEDVAVYTNAQFVTGITILAYRSLSGAALPNINETYISGDRTKLIGIYNRASVNIQIASAAMMLLVIVNLPNITALFPKTYAAIAPLVLILVLGRAADMFAGLNHELLSISRHYRFNLYSSVALIILILALNRIFIPRYGVFAAAWITALTTILVNTVKGLFLWRREGLQPLHRGTAKVLLVGGAVAMLNFAWPASGHAPILDGALRTLLILALYGAGVVTLRTSPDLLAAWERLRAKMPFL